MRGTGGGGREGGRRKKWSNEGFTLLQTYIVFAADCHSYVLRQYLESCNEYIL